MRNIRNCRPSPALGVALLALIVSLSGTAYAGFSIPQNSVGTKQLQKGAVTTKKIKNHSVTAAKINTKGLTVPNALQATNATSATHAATAGSAPPSGPAGGALTGTYPNPGVGAGVISESNIAPHTIGSSALGTISTVQAATLTIPTGTSFTASVQCPAGRQVISGGYDALGVPPAGYYVYAEGFDAPDGWSASVLNNTGSTQSLEVTADCLAP